MVETYWKATGIWDHYMVAESCNGEYFRTKIEYHQTSIRFSKQFQCMSAHKEHVDTVFLETG